MAPARGDTKPCTADGCAGTMQFDRRRNQAALVSAQRPAYTDNVGLDDRGWVCDTEPAHFRKAE